MNEPIEMWLIITPSVFPKMFPFGQVTYYSLYTKALEIAQA